MTLQTMLTVEDDPSLLALRCNDTGLPLWPQVRTVFLRMLLSDMLYGTAITGRSISRPPAKRAALTMAMSLHRNAALRGAGMQAEVFITGDGVADQPLDGRWFNRLVDHFVGALPNDTLVMADHFEWRWPFPRHHDRVFMHAPLQAQNSVRGRLGRHRYLARAQELLQIVADRARSQLDWTLSPARRAALTAMLASKAASLPWQYRAYGTLLQRVGCRLLLVGTGCYGPAAALIAAARDRDIVTAEYQHGAVSAGHDAYNFAPAVLADAAYRRSLPESFLGYGAWWNAQINAPLHKLAIGNPHRSQRLAAQRGQAAAAAPARRDLLILSDGIEFASYLTLARNVADAARRQGLRIVLRPHPLERSSVAAAVETGVGGIHIDQNGDLYASLATAQLVVSEVSTGLFEAVGIVPRILLWDTPKSRFGYPVHPFTSFASPDELVALLERGDPGELLGGLPVEAVWAEDWRQRYLSFVAAPRASLQARP